MTEQYINYYPVSLPSVLYTPSVIVLLHISYVFDVHPWLYQCDISLL